MPPHEKAGACNLGANKDAVASNEAIETELPDKELPTSALITKLRHSAFSKILQALDSRENVRVTIDPITGARRIVVEKANDVELISLARHLGVFPTVNGNMINHYDHASSKESLKSARAKLDKFLSEIGDRIRNTSDLPVSKE